MSDIFDYDVFLSFSSKDEETAKPVWQELSLSGLRVFWSDETLKQNVGQSFFDVIQESLINSRHFLLLMSANAAESKWVKLEYTTFFNQCFMRANDERRLIVYPIGGFDIARLPPFLQTLQVARSVKAVISLLGGVDVQALRRENVALREENAELRERVEAADEQLQKLRDEAAGLRRLNQDTGRKLSDANRQIRDLRAAAASTPSPEKGESTPARIPPRREVALGPLAEPPRRVTSTGLNRYELSEHKIGEVSEYEAKDSVATVALHGELNFGDRIRIKGLKTNFEQYVLWMKVGGRDVQTARVCDVTFSAIDVCRRGDEVYKIG